MMSVLGGTRGPRLASTGWLTGSAPWAGTKPALDGVRTIFSVSAAAVNERTGTAGGVGAKGLNPDKVRSRKAQGRVSSKPAIKHAEVVLMENPLKTVRGLVEATAQNAPDRFGVRIGEDWYDGFGSCPVNRGDEVEIQYFENDRFHNIAKVLVVEEGGARRMESRGMVRDDSRIARSVALKSAAAIRATGRVKAEDVIAVAEKFEGWLRAA